MTRKRYIQDESGELHEVSLDYIAPGRAVNTDAVLWNDRTYQDGNDRRFTSRKQHREYMKRTGLTTVDDFRNHFRKAEEQRIKVRQGYDPTRRSHIERAIYQLSEKRK